MPPRIDLLSCIRTQQSKVPFRSAKRTFVSTPSPQSSNILRRGRNRTPYEQAQARALRAANVSRQQTLQKRRAEELGDPVRGIETPFLQSLDDAVAVGVEPLQRPTGEQTQSMSFDGDASPLSFSVRRAELESSLQTSKELTDPRSTPDADPSIRLRREKAHEVGHSNASIALEKILSMDNAGAKEKHQANVRRLIDTFGRHKTDQILRAKPTNNIDPPTQNTSERVGPDTGSSEVQIAILTARIRSLSTHLSDLDKDKHSKRRLRLLVHQRQKLLKYLRRKERGGERWQFLTQTLGLTEGTWKGEITL